MAAKNTTTIAETWIERIDKPRKTGHYLATDKTQLRRMQDAAVDVQESYGDYYYIFKDGSAVYEKHKNDWFPSGNSYVKCPECDSWRADDDTDICPDCVEEDADAEETKGSVDQMPAALKASAAVEQQKCSVCGNDLVNGRCRFINHNRKKSAANN